MSDQDSHISTTEEETEFESAFAEFANSEEVDPDSLHNPTDEEKKVMDEDPGPGSGPNNGKVTTSVDTETETEDAFLASLSEEARNRFKEITTEKEELRHKFDSNAGRITAYQNKINGLEQEIQSIRKGATSGPDQPSAQDIQAALTGTDSDWEQFKEDYPAVAKAIDNRLAGAGKATQQALERTLNPVMEFQGKLAQEAETNAAKAAENEVAKEFPTWTGEVQKKEFKQWLDDQPPGIAALAGSDDTRDAVTLISLYDSHLVANGQKTLRAPTEPGGNSQEDTIKATEAADTSIAERRQRQLNDGAAIPSKRSGVTAGDAEAGQSEFDAAFNFYAKKRESA